MARVLEFAWPTPDTDRSHKDFSRPVASSKINDSSRKKQRPRTQPEINDYRRRALMEGTIQSMAENGVAFTTVQTISKAAGTSRGLIGHYFSSKEVLLAEAFRHLFQSLSAQVRSHADLVGATTATERLKSVPRALFSPEVFTSLNRDAFISFWHEVRFNSLMRKANRELYGGYIKNVEQLFNDAATENGVSLDARSAALGLIALSDGLWLGMSIHDQVISPDKAINLCELYIEEQLEG